MSNDAWAVAVLDAYAEQFIVRSPTAERERFGTGDQQYRVNIGTDCHYGPTRAVARMVAARALVKAHANLASLYGADPSLAPSPHPVTTIDRERALVRVIRTTGDGFTEALELMLTPGRSRADDRVLLERLLAVAKNLRVRPL